MKSIKIVAASIAALTLAGCANDEYIGNGDSPQQSKNTEISFAMKTPNMTRAEQDHATSAASLDNNFIVYGWKTAGETKSVVFDHYNVNYKESSANSTLSNTKDWEYVGQSHIVKGTTNQVLGNLGSDAAQTIKYWDFSTDKYDFVAFSLGKGVTATGETTPTYAKVETAVNNSSLNTKAYVLSGTTEQLAASYIADQVTINKTNYAATKTVTLKFRSLGTKVRVGLYETIPGYSISKVEFYPSATGTAASPAVLYTTGDAELPAGEGTMTMKFDNENKVHAAFTPKDADQNSANKSFGAVALNANAEKKEAAGTYLGRESNNASYAGYDATNKGYKTVLPNEEGVTGGLNLKVKFTLLATDGSGEEITVSGATALVPEVYTKWKANYAYTYLFKISQNVNGTTGTPGTPGTEPDPTGLYPITFDAVVISTEEGIQETITSVSKPSITTYAKGVNPTANNEYKKNNNIYVSTNAPQVELTATNSKLYTATLDAPTDAVYTKVTAGSLTAGNTYYTSATGAGEFSATGSENPSTTDYYKLTTPAVNPLQTITEASVANAIANGTESSGTYTVTDANGKKLVITPAASTLSFPTAISADDSPTGAAISGKYAMFKPTAAGYYVFEYSRPVSYDNGTQLTSGASLNGYYTKSGDTYTACGENDTAYGDTKYYKIKVPAGKFYKIINVVE